MKVYVATMGHDEDREVFGVFSSRARAEAAFDSVEDHGEVDEFEVDAIEDGESVGETYFVTLQLDEGRRAVQAPSNRECVTLRRRAVGSARVEEGLNCVTGSSSESMSRAKELAEAARKNWAESTRPPEW